MYFPTRSAVDPVPESLEDGDDAGCERAPGYDLKIPDQGPQRRPAELSHQPAIHPTPQGAWHGTSGRTPAFGRRTLGAAPHGSPGT